MRTSSDGYSIAVDLGASGGKMVAARLEGDKLAMLEFQSFRNMPVELAGHLYWDVFWLYNNIIQNLSFYAAAGVRADTIGIDTWGATYGLLDSHGRLLEPVYHYRDKRTAGVMQPMFDNLPARELFRLTGCQCNRTYTLPQLYSCVLEQNPCLENADQMLFLPDLLAYFLCGQAQNETSIAGTSALMSPDQKEWAAEVFERLDIPTHFLGPLASPASMKAPLLSHISQQTRIGAPAVVASIGHDSAAAVAAIPGFGPDQLYISIGTNVSMGIQNDSPVITQQAWESGLKNTGCIDDKIIVYRDFPAFWILNELCSGWRRQGLDCSHQALQKLAEQTASPGVVFDPEDPEINQPGGEMRRKINTALSKTGQKALSSQGQFVRCVLESIAQKIGLVAESIRCATGQQLSQIYAINGGIQNKVLMQLICDRLGEPVRAVMPYATLVGNILCQMRANRQLASLDEMRQVSENTFESKWYIPKQKPSHCN